MVIELDGRTFAFGENADEGEARRLVRALLDAEQDLAEAQAAGNDERIAQAKRHLYFVEGDLRGYQEMTRPDYRSPALDRQEEASPLSAGERAILAELREIRRAVLAPREMYPDVLGDLTKSRAVLSKEGEQQS
jgi:hypothetical protein